MSKDISLNVSNLKDESEDEANTMTLGDILKAEEMLEENAEAVLGPGDDKHCTFKEGYKKRQALYSCLTCTPVSGKERAGICLACSYHCHGDHDLVELFTKRNFKCDCGNSLFKGKCCFLDPAKSGTNENNVYNHNFEGKYCTCQRPYPDPEDDVEDEMLQCIVCEDWFHSRHLDSSVPKEYAEMICKACTDKLPFLQYYLGYSVSKVSESEEKCDSSTNISVDVCSPKSSPLKENLQNGASNEKLSSDQNETDCTTTQVSKVSESEEKCDSSTNISVDVCSPKSSPLKENLQNGASNEKLASDKNETNCTTTQECLLKSLKQLPRGGGATYWPGNFRKLLCACHSCTELYKSLNVSFLLDEEDTVQAYEDEGKERRRQRSEDGTEPSQSDQGMQQILSSMDRVQQMEAILGYNDLKTNLKDFLAKFVENKKVVREEDIHEFFSGMQARKRRKHDVPYNCR